MLSRAELEADKAALAAEMVLLRAEVRPKKGSKFWRAVSTLFSAVTFGRVPPDALMHYATTMGRTIYVPVDWDDMHEVLQLELMTHELHHVKQWDKWWILMSLWYVLPPALLAYGRYRIERAAYVEGYKVAIKYYPDVRGRCIDHGVEQMTGAPYFWTWPFPRSVRAWFEAHLPK